MKTMDVTQGDGSGGDVVQEREQALTPQPIERRTFLAGAWAALAGGFLSPALDAAASLGAEPQPVAVVGMGFDAGSGDATVMWEAHTRDGEWFVVRTTGGEWFLQEGGAKPSAPSEAAMAA